MSDEVESASPVSVAPATVEGLQEMEAAQAELQRQLRVGEITQEAYEEALTTLIETTSPAVLKASMAQRQDVHMAAQALAQP